LYQGIYFPLTHALYYWDYELIIPQVALTRYPPFILNAGEIDISDNCINISLKKKRTLPFMLDQLSNMVPYTYDWLGGKQILFSASNYT